MSNTHTPGTRYRMRRTSYDTYVIEVDRNDGQGFTREWEDTNQRDAKAVLNYLTYKAKRDDVECLG